jgi:VWFA-related protein
MLRTALSGLVCVLALLPVPPRGQQASAPPQAQAPVFRTAAELVEVHAVVRDRSGAIVRGLTREDFRVAEDGKAQDVVQFFFVDKPLPVSAPADRRPPLPASDVASNALPADRRLYVIVLDAANVDASRSTVVKRLARQFIEENLGPNDLASVIQLGRTAVNQPFTSDRALLVRALDQFIGHKPPSATVTIAKDMLLRPQNERQDSEAGSRSNEARRMLESLKQVCESLGAVRGFRRSLVLFSEGVDVDTSDLIGQDNRPGARGGADPITHDPAKTAGFVLQAQADLFAAARRSGVALYPIDPRGNTMGEDRQMEQLSSIPGMPSPGMSIMAEVQRGQGVLRTMAEQTGGQAVVGTGNFKAGFGSIVEANSSYYVLGYRSANTARDGSYRQISVNVNRSGVSVDARKGYVAPVDGVPSATPTAPNAPSPRMRELLGNALPGGSLPMRLAGGPVRPQDDKMLIGFVLEIDTAALTLKEDGGQLVNEIELAYLAIDPSGKVVSGDRRAAPLRLAPAQRAALASGLRFAAEFPAPPGRYQVRAAVHESAGDTSGSVLLDVDVPNLSKAPLSMGAVFLASNSSMTPDGSYPLLRSVLPGPPSATRQFAKNDTLAVFVNVFAAGGDQSRSVDVITLVHGADGREAFRHAVTRPGADVAAGKGGYGHTVSVPLAGFTPGDYLLTLTARSASGRSASRTVSYRVR